MAIPNGKPATGIPVFYTLTKIHKPNPVGRPYLAVKAQQNESHHLLVVYVQHFTPRSGLGGLGAYGLGGLGA